MRRCREHAWQSHISEAALVAASMAVWCSAGDKGEGTCYITMLYNTQAPSGSLQSHSLLLVLQHFDWDVLLF